MINKKKSKIEKNFKDEKCQKNHNVQNDTNNKINQHDCVNDQHDCVNDQHDCVNDQHDCVEKTSLIKSLENELHESNEKIIKIKIKSKKEIASFYDRVYKETEKSRKFSLEKILKDFLPIIDNIERALDLIKISKSKESFLKISKKLQFINNILQTCFMTFNIKKIDEINVLFDPSIHQAMSIHYTNEIESNKIITIMQPGYVLYDTRLLRPAMVVVSKKKI